MQHCSLRMTKTLIGTLSCRESGDHQRPSRKGSQQPGTASPRCGGELGMLLVGMLAREMGSPSSLCPLLFRQVELQHVGILEVPAAGLARGRCQGQLAEVPTAYNNEGVHGCQELA
eukprot:1146661-Pelagomonas_calceolata.AAC.2